MHFKSRCIVHRLTLALALFAGYAVLIGMANWPWPLHFQDGLPQHHDPPFHAWKLKVVADAMRAGHLLPADGNSNCFYPSSLTLYYEALHWPQAALAALVLQFTPNVVLIYNLVHLAFWALSGVCFYWMVRQFGMRAGPAAWAGAVFCILPYRVSYLVEFNMQQGFGFCLCLGFAARFLHRPGIVNAVGATIGFWLQAVSELYQALILLVCFPLMVLPLARDCVSRYGRQPRLYAGIAAALLVGGGLGWKFLGPYHTLHIYEGYAREMTEIANHSLEPLSYLLRPNSTCLLPGVHPRYDEMSVYPTLVVLLGALALAVRLAWARVITREKRMPGEVPRWTSDARWIRGVCLLAFAGIVMVLGLFPGAGRSLVLGLALNLLAIGAVASASVAAFGARGASNPRGAMLSGFGAAAALAFMMSLGPTIDTGGLPSDYTNLLFVFFYEHLNFLSAMRVVSRFSLVVLVFLVMAAAEGWSGLIRRVPRWASWLCWVALLGGVLFACRTGPPALQVVQDLRSSAALRTLAERPDRPILVFPFGDRRNDSLYMLTIAGTQRPLLYGWGGFYPSRQCEMQAAFLERDMAYLADLLLPIWPQPLLVVDRRPPARPTWSPTEIEASLAGHGHRLAEDDRFAVYELIGPRGPVPVYERALRTAALRDKPCLAFTVSTGGSSLSPVWVTVNGAFLTQIESGPEPRRHAVRVPEPYIVDVHGNTVRLECVDGQTLLVEGFRFFRGDLTEPDIPSVLPEPVPPSLQHLTELPTGSHPFKVRFRNQLELVGYQFEEGAVKAGETRSVRLYWRCAPDVPMFRQQVVYIEARAPDGARSFKTDAPLLTNVPRENIRCQPYPRLFVQEIVVPVPVGTIPGSHKLAVGLWDMAHNRTIRGRSEGAESHRTFRLPTPLEVQ